LRDLPKEKVYPNQQTIHQNRDTTLQYLEVNQSINRGSLTFIVDVPFIDPEDCHGLLHIRLKPLPETHSIIFFKKQTAIVAGVMHT
jgi:hypothetical protein